MRITIACIGRDRDSPAAALYQDYARRLPWSLTLKQVEEKRKLPAPELIKREAQLLLAAVPAGAVLVALDERGRSLGSRDFAARLGKWQESTAELAFLIGGAGGLDADLKARADLLLSLGPMTWPHLLVRALLAEQLYRAHSILTNHPYHRG